jgi:hypothetical protein
MNVPVCTERFTAARRRPVPFEGTGECGRAMGHMNFQFDRSGAGSGCVPQPGSPAAYQVSGLAAPGSAN